MQKKNYIVTFILVCSLFFLWAFLHNLNVVLIPHLKKACQLSDTQSSFIDSAIYLGYFLAAIPAGLYMHKFGYKKGILMGLLLFGSGALLFMSAGYVRDYAYFLFALFVFASGATFLETCANPYVTLLGNPNKSEQRLNFAQSFNGLGAAVAPMLGSMFVLSGVEYSKDQLNKMTPDQLHTYLQSESSTVIVPYAVFAGVVAIVFILFFVTKIPEPAVVETEGHASVFSWTVLKQTFSVLRHKFVMWAVIAEFAYVGAQTGVGSFFVRLTHSLVDLPEKKAGYFWGSIAMVGFMAGRFVGTFLMQYVKPAKLLSLYAMINIALLAVALSTKGWLAVYAVMASPFFMSLMFPTIFALGIKGLGEEAKYASSLLVMSIVGGGLVPVAMGLISDKTGSMQTAYIMPLLCFVVILFFGLKGYKMKGTLNYTDVEQSPVVV
ncbi:MAG TPA: L-fucose:H+ symporter permease [Chitinophagaceae bacterium]|nr:L-fucose:H+ symporter permease [Chitinophagaceae bacterium]